MLKIRVAIVDDKPQLADAIAEKLSFLEELEIQFACYHSTRLLALLNQQKNLPDVILMDIEMPEMDGIELTFRVRQAFPAIRVVMLTVFNQELKIFNAIRAGACGYLLKDASAQELLLAIREAMQGGAPMSAPIAVKALQMMLNGYRPPVAELFSGDGALEELTAREKEILELIAAGASNQDLANRLFLSVATVKKHVENIYTKLQLHSRLELMNWYRKL